MASPRLRLSAIQSFVGYNAKPHENMDIVRHLFVHKTVMIVWRTNEIVPYLWTLSYDTYSPTMHSYVYKS